MLGRKHPVIVVYAQQVRLLYCCPADVQHHNSFLSLSASPSWRTLVVPPLGLRSFYSPMPHTEYMTPCIFTARWERGCHAAQAVFRVDPVQVLDLAPKASVTFTVKGLCGTVGAVEESLVCLLGAGKAQQTLLAVTARREPAAQGLSSAWAYANLLNLPLLC